MSSKYLQGLITGFGGACLLVAGYWFGQQDGGESERQDSRLASPVASITSATGATGMEEAPAESVSYAVPDSLQDIPPDWRTTLDNDPERGYAIWVDPSRRELIVERCHHRGHYDPAKKRVIPDGWEFCENVLWGELIQITNQRALARSRTGQEVSIELALDEDTHATRQLTLTFEGHHMTLVPGSKNELFQAMDNTDVMREQRALKLRTQLLADDRSRG